jgi:hypothetical protein
MKKALFGLALAMVVSSASFASSGSNCRLIVHTSFKDGKKKVSVEEIGAQSHEECRLAAQSRQLDSEGDDVKRVKVVFGFRALSVISDAEAGSQE